MSGDGPLESGKFAGATGRGTCLEVAGGLTRLLSLRPFFHFKPRETLGILAKLFR